MSDEEKNQPDQIDTGEGQRQPVFNLAPAVAAIAGLFVAIHAAESLVLNESSRQELLVWFAFIPYRLLEIAGSPGGAWPLLWTPITHAFLHAGWDHVLLNTVWFVIFATPVAQRYGGVRMVILFLGGAIAGAAAFAAASLTAVGLFELVGGFLAQLASLSRTILPAVPSIAEALASMSQAGLNAAASFSPFPILIGASGGVSALTGAAIRFMFQPVKYGVNGQAGERVVLGRELASIADVFRHPTARLFTIVWIVLNAGVPLLPLLMPDMGVEVAWQAHLGGFVMGFFTVPLFERKHA